VTRNSKAKKRTIFVSHASADQILASNVEKALRKVIGDRAIVFSSSAVGAIQAGDDWLNQIERQLSVADALVVLLTPLSLERWWLWFEVGAVWSRWRRGACRIYPLCFSGVGPLDLPSPLNRAQARHLEDESVWRHFLNEIAEQFVASPVGRKTARDVFQLPTGGSYSEDIDNSPGSLRFVSKVIDNFRSPRIRASDGFNRTGDIRFDILARLVLGILGDVEKLFSTPLLYIRTVKALTHVSDEVVSLSYSANDFLDDMEVLRVVEVVKHVHRSDIWSLTPLGAELVKRWPQWPESFDYSESEIEEILGVSAGYETPTVDEAEALFDMDD